jgi:hypothetical protein
MRAPLALVLAALLAGCGSPTAPPAAPVDRAEINVFGNWDVHLRDGSACLNFAPPTLSPEQAVAHCRIIMGKLPG